MPLRFPSVVNEGEQILQSFSHWRAHWSVGHVAGLATSAAASNRRVRSAGSLRSLLAFGQPLTRLMLHAAQSELHSYIPLVPFVAGYLLFIRAKAARDCVSQLDWRNGDPGRHRRGGAGRRHRRGAAA